MRTLKITLPDSVDLNKQEALLMLASKLFEKGKLSLGQGAKMAGYSKRAFMEVLSNYGVSIFNSNPDDLDKDVANAKNYNL